MTASSKPKSDAATKASHKPPRRAARELALQGLYEWRMSGNSIPMIEEHLEQSNPEWMRADRALLLRLLRGASDDVAALETHITPHLDRPLSELSPIEYAILLLGAFELKHCLETPYRVVINEGIELTKSFGGSEGHKYVNGVLDKLAADFRSVEVLHTQQQGKS